MTYEYTCGHGRFANGRHGNTQCNARVCGRTCAQVCTQACGQRLASMDGGIPVCGEVCLVAVTVPAFFCELVIELPFACVGIADERILMDPATHGNMPV